MPSKRPPSTIPSLRELLPRLLGKMADQGDARTLHVVWKEVVGEPACRYAKPDALQAGTLEIAVCNAQWATALSRQSDVLLARLQQQMGSSAIRRLVFAIR